MGVNFSQAIPVQNLELPEVADRVKKFAYENSSELPDYQANQATTSTSKPQKPDERYQNHHRSVLHDAFNSDNPGKEVSYSTFLRWWPTNVLKPNLNDRRTCLCKACENASLKVQSLKSNKLIENINIFEAIKQEELGDPNMIENIWTELEELKKGIRKDEVIAYRVWEDVIKHVEVEEKNLRITQGVK